MFGPIPLKRRLVGHPPVAEWRTHVESRDNDETWLVRSRPLDSGRDWTRHVLISV
ncbi:hypothetical protein K438DRAFT_1835367 [Mycena galopus ATCC 62051]|nr:hypothetical protein K438DRAFT_1835367 [Mycena galopus ATCC 62051]